MIVQVCASGGFKRESIRSARFETWPQSAALANRGGGQDWPAHIQPPTRTRASDSLKPDDRPSPGSGTV